MNNEGWGWLPAKAAAAMGSVRLMSNGNGKHGQDDVAHFEEVYTHARTGQVKQVIAAMAAYPLLRWMRKANDGQTLMHGAAVAGDRATIFYLIGLGLDVNARAYDGSVPLHFGVEVGNAQTVKALVEGGADVNAHDCEGQTPLTVAAMWDRTSMIEFLVKHGAIVDAADSEGITPLHHAVRCNNVAALKLLLRYGADPQARDHSGMAAFDHAVASKAMDTASALYTVKG